VRILSGVLRGPLTTGTPIQLMIENTDQRSRITATSPSSSGPAMPTSPITRNTAARSARRRPVLGARNRVAGGGRRRGARKVLAALAPG
jgi:chorismate synthase